MADFCQGVVGTGNNTKIDQLIKRSFLSLVPKQLEAKINNGTGDLLNAKQIFELRFRNTWKGFANKQKFELHIITLKLFQSVNYI